ncbi:MAG: DUF1549 and DUF1553 domain-containing protein, partial [Planctomycetota bacterium]
MPDRSSGTGWSRDRIDEFTLQVMQRHGLEPSPQAPPSQWLRRASFDLTGLPPMTEQLVRFETALARSRSLAATEAIYAAEVDRMLATDAFGERWASLWMDLARYADSMGFEKDPHRAMWPYRDWLIDAFNQDMPYDAFSIKQLAGDLLPDATASDWVATAFHRNTQTNTEGGTDDEEFRVAAIIDRVNTTWTIWQATTFGCVQCHSHPYDPYQHEEYYKSLALFNNTLDADLNDDFPTITVPESVDDREAAIDWQSQWLRAREDRNNLGRELLESDSWQPIRPLLVESTGGRLAIRGSTIVEDGGTFPVGVAYTVEFPARSMSVLRVDILPSSDQATDLPENASLLTQLRAELVGESGRVDSIPLATVFASGLATPYQPDAALKNNREGVGGYPKLFGPQAAAFVLAKPIDSSVNAHARIRLTLSQGASTAGNIASYLRRFRLSSSTNPDWQALLQSETLKAADQRLVEIRREVQAVQGAKLPVIASRPSESRRETRVFIRGNWLDRGDPVDGGIPRVLDRSPEGVQINDRLAFANWLVGQDNPLAARVWANRIWAQLFGRGIVETLEDFGSSGLLPTHPRLLDYLATRVRDHHRWRLKPFLRELVLSSTYRQDHRVTPESLAMDAGNRYLARGPRTRLSAEMIRDQALAASGLMTKKIGGPSVMPPQPDGIWQTV